MGGIVFIALLTVLVGIKNTQGELQLLPELCQPSRWISDHECPDVHDEREYQRLTAECCGSHPSTGFHCQEQMINGEPYIVVACLPSVMPSPGIFIYLNEIRYPHQPLPNVTMEFHPCPPESYEPRPKASYLCRYPHCSEKKQICSIQYGKFEIFSGNASHDRTCLCDWANGWKPVHSISQECTDPAGFHSHMMCYCRQSRCPAGQKLGKDYQCFVDQNASHLYDTSTKLSTTKVYPPTSPHSKASAVRAMHCYIGLTVIRILLSLLYFT